MSHFNNQKLGSNGFNWWIGQIEDDSSWKTNQIGEKWTDPDKIPGWGMRYKVRIIGKHSEDRRVLPADSLEMCEVMYPVTAGTGHAASFQTSNLRKGSYVIGFYKDGMSRQEPIIMGCLGNNDQTKLASTFTLQGFKPTSGFSKEIVPPYAISPGGSPPQGSGSGSPPPENPIEGVGLGNRTTEADIEQQKSGEEESDILSPESCRVQLDGVQTEIKKFIRNIENFKKRTKKWSYWINNKTSEITSQIEGFILSAATAISGWIKNLLNSIRQKVIEKINNAISDFYFTLFPDEESKLCLAHRKVIDTITCLFNKIISNLLKMISKILSQIIDRYINVPLCAVENIISSLLGKLIGLIEGTILNAVQQITSIVGGAINIAGDILGIISNILGIFLCDEQQNCPTINKWSTWNGPSSSTLLDMGKIFDKAKQIASTAQQIVDPNNFSFDMNFDDIFEDSCNVGPIFCGPPTVEFFGGGGIGASGNAIINAAGNILGVDITSPGINYTSTPTIKFVDACGNGSGATGTPIIGSIPIVPPELTLVATQINSTNYKIEWTTTNADNITSDFNASGLNGFIVDSPISRKTYTLTAYGKNNTSVSKTVVANPTITKPTGPTGPTGSTKSACQLATGGPGIYLDLTGYTGIQKVTIKTSEESSIFHTINIPGVGAIDENAPDKTYDLEGGKVYGPCTATIGTLYIGEETPAGGKNKLIIEEGGDDWNDMTLTVDVGKFIRCPTPVTTPVAPGKACQATTIGHNGDGIYLDLTKYVGDQVVIFTTSESSAIAHSINIQAGWNIPKTLKTKTYTLMGGRVYGPCTTPNGKLYIGKETPVGGDNKLIVEEGGDDWDDMVLVVSIGSFVRCSTGSLLPDLTLSAVPSAQKRFKITYSTKNAVRIDSNFTAAANNSIVNGIIEVDPPDVGKLYEMTAFDVNDIPIKKTIFLQPTNTNTPPPTNPLPQLDFTSKQVDVNKYELTWKTKDATRVVSNFGKTDLSSSTIIDITKTTVVTLTAYNVDNKDISKSLTLVFTPVTTPPPPVTNNVLTFTAKLIRGNNTYELEWNAIKASSIKTNFGGTTISGKIEVTPNIKTNYIVTAYWGIVEIEKSIELTPINDPCPPIPQISSPPPATTSAQNPAYTGVIGVVITNPGSGYLSSPNGSLGGDGRTWANSDDTIVQRLDGTYDTPYSPGETVQLNKCDEVSPPCQPKFRASSNYTYTAPKGCSRTATSNYPNTNTGSYPVILYICGITISNTGVNYATTDKIVVEPANGAILEPTFGPFGALIGVKIIESGSGFKQMPNIYIESQTGYNAKLIPTLCVQRIGDIPQNQDQIPIQTKVIDVVDCVGKF